MLLVGLFGLPMSAGVLVAGTFIAAIGPIMLVPAVLAGVAVLYVAGSMTPRGSVLTDRSWGRLAWATGVLFLGTAGLMVMVAATTGRYIEISWLWMALFTAAPYALAAGVLAGGWVSVGGVVLSGAWLVGFWPW
ncbi:hypothetical protein ACFWY5_07875 [Nonomuraea sp. NPDC059007]|uniref:hypothetical protein n=1 Tax=Nonomuraea sp. NPDC059007 TaxID=3346692 RepID=UPI003679B51C